MKKSEKFTFSTFSTFSINFLDFRIIIQFCEYPKNQIELNFAKANSEKIWIVVGMLIVENIQIQKIVAILSYLVKYQHTKK